MKKKGMSVKFITQAAVIAAIYVVLVVIFNYISFGPVQFRIAEALTILPYFTPAAIPGLFVGCIIANILGGAIVWDVVFGYNIPITVDTRISVVPTFRTPSPFVSLFINTPLSNTFFLDTLFQM